MTFKFFCFDHINAAIVVFFLFANFEVFFMFATQQTNLFKKIIKNLVPE